LRRTPAALKIERLQEQVRKLKAEREQPETEAIAALKRQLEARNTRIANLQGLVRALQADLADIRSHKGHPITKALHREIRASRGTRTAGALPASIPTIQ
jgi:DNA repair exonuclease SbcCD ATPase subunit